jgi:hypothetical protein
MNDVWCMVGCEGKRRGGGKEAGRDVHCHADDAHTFEGAIPEELAIKDNQVDNMHTGITSKCLLHGRFDGVKPSVFSCVEAGDSAVSSSTRTRPKPGRFNVLLLRALDVEEHAVKTEYALLETARLLAELSCLCRRVSAGFALNHDVKVNELLGESRHVILEAERVFSGRIGSEDVVALALTLAVKEDLVRRVADLKVDVEVAAALDLEMRVRCKRERGVDSRHAYGKVELETWWVSQDAVYV